MEKNIWTVDAIVQAVLNNNAHLNIIYTNYLKSFVERLGEYEITLQGVSSIDALHKQVVEGIERLEPMIQEFISAMDIFVSSNHPLLKSHLPAFFERLLNFYEERGITLYSGTGADLLRNDHYRFFNQHLFLSLTALLLENRCFDALNAILHAKYNVFYKSYGMLREVNFMRMREYNYTLNDFLNTGYPKRISVTADYMYKYSGDRAFEKLVKADILLYYLSLWNPSSEMLDPYWYPELSVYNRDQSILPQMASRKFFEEAKVLFGVNTVSEYKRLLDETTDRLQRGSIYRVPMLKVGLMYNEVGSME